MTEVPTISMQTLARRFAIGTTVVIVFALLIIAAAVLGGTGEGPIAVKVDGEGLSRGATSIAVFIVGGFCIGFLWAIRSALWRVANGDTFGPAVRSKLTRASILMIAGCITKVVLPSILMLFWPAVPGKEHFSLEIDGSDALWLLTAVGLYFVTRLLACAEAFESDSQQVI